MNSHLRWSWLCVAFLIAAVMLARQDQLEHERSQDEQADDKPADEPGTQTTAGKGKQKSNRSKGAHAGD